MASLGTKAQNLVSISGIAGVNVLPVYVLNSNLFDFDTLSDNNKTIIDEIILKLGRVNLIVRSSCKGEDQLKSSSAGKYDSVLNVFPSYENVYEAIKQVFDSYNSKENEEILIQPMLKDTIKSGVVFTRDLYTAAPYYCINFEEGKDTAAITSGGNSPNRQQYIFRNVDLRLVDKDAQTILFVCKLLENHFGNDYLDIEFGFNRDHKLYIFQVRPIAVQNEFGNCDAEVEQALYEINKKVKKLMQPRPFIAGNTSFFGVMPDWNPAEIIGIKPKRLAISLYKELITDNIWANQRESYGYKDVKQNPLMAIFCGVPYIDTRITFNSFIPASLNNELTEKLVNYYLCKLKNNPHYHDKIEFNIVFSCFYIGIEKKLNDLSAVGFNQHEYAEIKEALLIQTNRIINFKDGLYKRDLAKVGELNEKYNRIINSDLSSIDKIYWLIEVCKNSGTLPFAGVARSAFIATQILKSLVEESVISHAEYNMFMENLHTISHEMKDDMRQMSKNQFIEKYGHIRPGTYDIESTRYDESYELYFGKEPLQGNGACDDKKDYNSEWNTITLNSVNTAFEECGLDITAEEFVLFAKQVIEGRELLKFEFTRLVSEILREIEIYGSRLGICRDDLAHLDLEEIKRLYSNLYVGDVKKVFLNNITYNKEQYEVTKYLKLPSLILSEHDVYIYSQLKDEPNYITTKSVISKVISGEQLYSSDVKDKIICIEAADPGYDFLFSREIGGLITKYGGANSHMAIRCAELQIPAIIGAGDGLYEICCKSNQLLIDCGNKQVKIVS